MPSRNIIKTDAPDCYYHIYARGNNKQNIFIDDDDFATFLNLFKRYLADEQSFDNHKVPYPHLKDKLHLIGYCLMPNHFHALVYQIEKGAMETLMRGVLTSYSRYFNKKYDRCGPLLESRYKASTINAQQYLKHIARYIVLNPKSWLTYKYSCLPYYLGTQKAEWFDSVPILELFNNKPEEFKGFLNDYKDYKKVLDNIKYELANDVI